MSRILYKIFAVSVAISMIIALPAVALPQAAPTATHSEAPVSPAVAVQPVAPVADGVELGGEVELPQGLKDQTGPTKVVIELVDEPAATIYAAAQAANKPAVEVTAATRAQITRIDAAQKALLPALDKLGATVIYRTQRVYNGIAAIVDGEKLSELAKQPGIKAIHPLVTKSLDNWNSVPLIGAPQLWDQAGVFGGLDGDGIRVGIIDTGIDYMHANFGGPATQGSYEANDTTVITDTYMGNLLYPTMKVVGGWDFVGDDYDAGGSGSQLIPVPDPDPADCGDHGSHVSGTAAGYGVNADGTTFTGTYSSDLDFSQFKIGPGVAPMAELYSLRVFGCEGSTDVTDQAIEWATDPNGDGDFSDHLDVINMSLGSSYGSIYDSSAVASDNAALAGVLVVMSSGNSGDVYYVTGSPGIAARGISVAGSDDGAAILDGFEVVEPASLAGVHPASESVAYNWASSDLPMTGDLVYPLAGSDPAQDQRTGCYTYDITNTQIISGNFVLMDWNEPSCGGSVTRGARAVAAGAIGAIMVDNSGAFDLYITGSSVIPAYSAPKSVGDALKAALASGAVQLIMTNEYKGSVRYNEPAYQNTVYSSSSRGPRRGDSLLKPDIAAPAVSVFSTQNAWPWDAEKGDGTTGVSYNGTSMAAPHVAGSMALLKQLHPSWSVEELKSLAMNTATTDITQANGALPKYTPARIGAGRITLPNAASSQVIAFNATEPWLTSVSFGAVEVNGTAEVTKWIKVVNKGDHAAKFAVSYAGYANVPGVAYTVSPSMLNLPAYGTGMVAVKMTADATQMKHTADPTVSTSGGRSWMTEASGYVVLQPSIYTVYLPIVVKSGAAPAARTTGYQVVSPYLPLTIRVPVHAAPRPASDMYASVSSIAFTGVTGTATIPVTGTGINTGSSYPLDIVSLATAYELAEASPNDPGYPGTDNADLKYVGVTNDNRVATGGFVTNTTVYFGISTWGDHNTAYAADAEFDIYIDSPADGNLDGNWDYIVYNTQAGSDIFVTAVYNRSTGATTPSQYVNITPDLATYPFNNNVLVMPVSARHLGLTNANPRFGYWVVTFSREEPMGDPVDWTADHSYSAATAGLDFTNNPLELPGTLDLPGNAANVTFNLAAYQANGSQGALLLHHHNEMGMREEVIDVTVPTNYAAVTIMHTNDFHGNLEPAGSNPGMARLSYKINQVRNEVGVDNTLLFDAGDFMQSTLLSNLKKGEPTVDLYNFVGYDLGTYGNHEFDWGQQVLISRTTQADYPFVVSNLVVKDAADCASSGWTTPVSFTVKPWITMTVGAPGNQAVIGVLGLTSIETPYITIAEATQGLCFKDPVQAVAHHYNAVKAAGADVIVVLSHNGNTDGGYGYGFTVIGDQTLAKKLVEQGTPANIIIGGHSHTDLTAAQVVSGTTVVQAHYAGRKLGRLDLVINKTTDTATVKWTRIVVGTSDPQDAPTQARVNLWANDPAYQAQINQVIGFSNVDLVRNYDGDNLMGTLVNDAIYNDLNSDGDPANDVDMVFNNSGGLRTDLTSASKPFTLTYGMMYSILPFGNATLVGDMTGAQIQDLLNQAATLFKGAIQVSGIRYSFYSYTDTLPNTAQPWAWGAYSITVKNRNTMVWEPLVMTKTYRIATNEFLAPAGQDGFVQFKYVKNYSYWGDMLNQVNHYISTTHGTLATAYNGPDNNGLKDGRITRNGTSTYNPSDPTQVVPVNILHHNDSHGNLLKGAYVGYTQLATMINQERAHNPSRTLLLSSGDNIQGDAMMYYYKSAGLGYAADQPPTTLPVTMSINPLIKAFNAMNYDAYTLGNHEFNFGNLIFTSSLKLATFPVLQANLYDDGSYGLAEVGVKPYITKTLPGPAGNIDIAVLGIGNHRVPNYELPSNIPGLTFTDPITETNAYAPGLKAANDAVIALTHIGFTENPSSVEIDNNVDTNLAAQTTGVDAIIGGHSHTNPATGFGDYKFLPTFVGAPDNTPVIINHAYRYNNTLGTIVLGMLPNGSGGYDVVSRAGRYQTVGSSVVEDPTIYGIVKPYDDLFSGYKNGVVGTTAVPLDATQAFITETNAANLQVDASLWKLEDALAINVDFHLSGAMTNRAIAAGATAGNPVTMTINDMFTLMPYENSLVVFQLTGAQLKTILERAYRNYWYYKYVSGYGGYSYYTTCNLDISAGGIITYTDDPITYTTAISHVVGLSFGSNVVDLNDNVTQYTVSTVNYVAAGSCNFNDNGNTLWPLGQILQDTQFYVRDAVIEYVPTITNPIAPAWEGRLRYIPVP